jgi:formate hydrogenlyase subunit 6/NADH:ubiquinone oxidoreductase subunit I
MLKLLLARLSQGHRTTKWPDAPASLPDRFRGGPELDPTKCPDGCRVCVAACPTDALRTDDLGLSLDLGRCLFCTASRRAPEGAIAYSIEHRLAARARDDLVTRGRTEPRAKALEEKLRRLFGRSLKLRQVSAGGATLRSGRQRARNDCLRPRAFRYSDGRFAPPRGRAAHHGPGDRAT